MSDTVDSLFLVGRRSGEALAMTKSVEVATLVIAHFREEWSRSDIGSQEQHEAMARMAGATAEPLAPSTRRSVGSAPSARTARRATNEG